MPNPYNPNAMRERVSFHRPGPYTQGLLGLLVGVSLAVSLLDRQGGGLLRALMYDRNAILHGEVWRLVTYPWLKTSPLSLLLSAVVLAMFCGAHERMWGGRNMLRFVLQSLLGAGLLALPLGLVLGALMPFADSPLAAGPDAAIDAMLMVTALTAPRSQMLFGFVLPMQARTFVWLMVAFEVIGGIMNQVAQLSLTLAGLAMGYLLFTKVSSPRALWQRIMGPWLRRRQRRHLYVVPPKRPNRTLH